MKVELRVEAKGGEGGGRGPGGLAFLWGSALCRSRTPCDYLLITAYNECQGGDRGTQTGFSKLNDLHKHTSQLTARHPQMITNLIRIQIF